MPEHSETTPTPSTNELTLQYMQQLSPVIGARIIAEFAGSHRLQHATWIVTTTTQQGTREDWRVQVTKVATH